MPDQTFTSGQILTAAQMTALQSNSGLVPITPGSVTNGTLSGYKISIAGQSTCTINDIFSTNYDAYQIVCTEMTGSTNMWITFKFGATTTGYYAAHDSDAFTNRSTFDEVMYATSNGGGGVVNVVNPFLAKYTQLTTFSPIMLTGGGMSTFGGFIFDTTSYTSMTVSTSGGTFTGTIVVYGFRKS
jgi:hypothetical protein